MTVRDYLKEQILLFDGAMGSYFSSLHSDPLYPCEYANLSSPHTISEIHKRYLQAGAKAIKTNTFSVQDTENAPFAPEELVKSGYSLAKKQAESFDAYVFCDMHISPGTGEKDLFPWYCQLLDWFLEEGGEHFLFETCPSLDYINRLAEYLKKKAPDSFLLVSFAVDSQGFSKMGQEVTQLLEGLSPLADAYGVNCICGPHHMAELVETLSWDRPFSAMPNASYPTVLGNRVSYGQNAQYFGEKMLDMVSSGCKILGGCCGTTPEFIAQLKQGLERVKFQEKVQKTPVVMSTESVKKSAFYEKLKSGKKPIALEWDSPVVPEIQQYMLHASRFQEAGVDLITIADGPGARPRMDSSLVACKLKRELNLDALPHMTCRDRNMNACKALLLGLSVEEINNVLLITGDPIPQAQRNEVKAVYEFNSRILMQHISKLNESLFHNPFYLYGALNVNAVNFDVQLRMAKEKIAHGAVALFTQPVMSSRGYENLKRSHEELSVPLLGGIYPGTSLRNLNFLENEMSGFHVCPEIFQLYEGKSPEECEEVAVRVSSKIAEEIAPFVEGFYLITPFTKVDMMLHIIENVKKFQ